MEVVGAAFAVQAAKPGRPVGLLEVRRSDRAACAGQVSGWKPCVPGWPSAGFGVGRTEAERAATAGGTSQGASRPAARPVRVRWQCWSPSVWQLKPGILLCPLGRLVLTPCFLKSGNCSGFCCRIGLCGSCRFRKHAPTSHRALQTSSLWTGSA